ncbi:MAG: cytochrome c oxidase subunit [Geobacteraceae bacterium]|nr:MAG: cytochrome c oxidase subunit [Geobacteraceae bacterium]
MLNYLRHDGVSRIAGEVDAVFVFITLIGLFFFLITQGFLIYFALRYRKKKRGEETETPYITGNRWLETAWVVVPSLLILAIFIYGYLVFRDIRTPPAGAAEINVIVRQWLFEFRYPDGRRTINEVRVPVGKPVKFIMTSQDVIHGFYLPAFRVKQDILPGRYTHLWVQPEKTGRFDIYCTQYCGVGHSNMRAVMVVMGGEDYEHWAGLEEEMSTLPLAKRGEELVEHSGCLACHSLDGTVKVGPTLKGLYGRRVELADGTAAIADDTYIRESILEPNARIVKGFPPVMPTFKGTIKDDDITAIIAYIKTLK